MLSPGTVPHTEPDIRVGIILPEDAYTSLTVNTPLSAAYQLEFSGRTISLDKNKAIFFKHTTSGVEFTIDDQIFSAPNKLCIYPVKDSDKPEPQSGLEIKNVVSGRDFHWKKYIDVTLSGKIIIEKQKDRLIVINELPIEHYLMCVATSEMGAACPPALIEAQTITARSWMLANVEQKHVHLGMDVCNDDCCQRYQGTTYLTDQSVQGALSTYGQVLMYDQKICDARYSKSCGGVMESFENIWPGDPLPYLQVIADAPTDPDEWHRPLSDNTNFEQWLDHVPHTFCSPHTIPENELTQYLGSVDEDGHYFRWEVVVIQPEITQNINRFHSLKASQIRQINILKRGGSGRAMKIAVEYVKDTGNIAEVILNNEFTIRQSLHKNFLYSSAITITPQNETKGIPAEFFIKGAGWGHGVGLCQIGALGMSLKNYSSTKIVLHYYPGSKLEKIY